MENAMAYPLEMIPQWCGMALPDHDDGLGGCWGISSGEQPKFGEPYCKSCDFYKSVKE